MNILDRKISATLLTLTVDVICTIMFMQKPFGLSKNMRLKCTIVHYTCSVEMPAACSSMGDGSKHHTMVSCSHHIHCYRGSSCAAELSGSK